MGVLDVIKQEVASSRSSPYQTSLTSLRPDWDSAQWQTLLYESIRDFQYPKTLLFGFGQSAVLSVFTFDEGPTPGRIIAEARRVMAKHNVYLKYLYASEWNQQREMALALQDARRKGADSEVEPAAKA
jgi:hypothetical protein